jgi:GR25 family glycosyltransferase involved in LPS biosynthesis
MENIDVVFYINLAHRQDRKEHIEAQIKGVGIPESKVQRIDAVKRTPGALGCTLSHIKMLEQFMENSAWQTAMVLEDDFTFAEAQTFEKSLADFQASFPDWECLTLSFMPQHFAYLDTSKSNVKKVLKTFTTSGYIIRKPFVSKLLNNWRLVADLHMKLGDHGHTACDVSWCALQPAANWYAFMPAAGFQCDSYSDITNYYKTDKW